MLDGLVAVLARWFCKAILVHDPVRLDTLRRSPLVEDERLLHSNRGVA